MGIKKVKVLAKNMKKNSINAIMLCFVVLTSCSYPPTTITTKRVDKPLPPHVELHSLPAQAKTKYSLVELEGNVIAAPEVLSAMAELEATINARDASLASHGPSILAGAGYSHNREPESLGSENHIVYQQWHERFGLGIPILGAWARQKADILQSESRLFTAQQRLSATKNSSLASLRSAYVIRWQEIQRRKLLKKYLENTDVISNLLLKRVAASNILPSDYKVFLATVAEAKSQYSVSYAIEVRSRNVMRLATGIDVSPEQLEMPSLPRICSTPQEMANFISQKHPEIIALKGAVDKLSDLPSSMALSPFDARLEGGYTNTTDNPGSSGQGAAVGLRFEMPIEVFSVSKAQKMQGEAIRRKANYDLLFRKEQLLADLQNSIALQNASLQQIISAKFKIESAASIEKIFRLRLNANTDVTLEKYSLARYELLLAAQSMLNAMQDVLGAQLEILLVATDIGATSASMRDPINLIPNSIDVGSSQFLALFSHPFDKWVNSSSQVENTNDKFDATLANNKTTAPFSILGIPATLSRKEPPTLNRVEENLVTPKKENYHTAVASCISGWNLGAYVWDGTPFLSHHSRVNLLQKAKELGIHRLLVSFTGSKLAQLKDNPNSLLALIDESHKYGIDIIWLLGDPSWILPEFRDNLLGLITSFIQIPFAGIHLDIEQDQLPKANSRRKELSSQLLDTFAAVVKTSPWPVGVSLHPRYLSANGETPGFAKDLSSIGINELIIMAYTTKAEVLVNKVNSSMLTLKDFPHLHISIAQSFEKSEPTSVSHFSESREEISVFLQHVTINLPPQIEGLVIQNFEDYISKK